MIRRRQKAEYQGRIIGCDFCDNDFAKIAQGFCAAGERITSMDGLRKGMENAQCSELPYVLDIVVAGTKVFEQSLIHYQIYEQYSRRYVLLQRLRERIGTSNERN